MRLATLLPALVAHPAIGGVGEDLAGARLSVISPARAAAVAALHARLRRPLLLLTARPGEARRYADELCAWAADGDALLFPEMDALPYDYLPTDPHKLADRMTVLRALADPAPDRPPLVVASARAAMDLLLPPDALRARRLVIRRGTSLPPARLAQTLLELGFEPAPLVDQPGLFGRRGGIVDVFPPGDRPLRLEFWGDDVDSIRAFDTATQRSSEQLEEATIGPAHEVLPRPLPPDALDPGTLRPAFRGPFERDLRALADGQAFPALEFYRGAFGSATLLDYLPPAGVLVVEERAALLAVAAEFEQQAEGLHADLLERGEVPRGVPRPYAHLDEALRRMDATPRRVVDVAFDPDAASLPIVHAPRFGGRVEAFLEHLERAPRGRSVVVTQQTDRLLELARERGIAAAASDTLAADPAADSGTPRVTLVHGLLREGWRSDELGLELLTDSEIFGWSKQRRAAGQRRRPLQQAAANRDQFIAELAEGDYVVHEDHGIARYRGLVSSTIGFSPEQPAAVQHAPPGRAEFLLLEYAQGDRLYVPISQADRVSRYIGAGDAQPSLTRLGSGEWSRAKARVRRSVRDIARELMDLYATRQTVHGHAYPPDTAWQQELEGSFLYEETPDQAQAIQEVKRDMQHARPMDRLLVGDVGFGKTEVALRAAFKAVQDGRQVGVLVPTTVLAQQHYNTFKDRLAPFPVRVEMLSRFRSEKEQRQVLKGLADGSVDICIGTHRLVQKDVRFKALGLAIIDEEQRFGVAHKERLKQLRQEVDVLTLTATPIPRTLHMGLVGVRDMSILETPPEARLPVRTYVTEYDDGLVREALLREIDRNGQVYFVHNRVNGIERVAAKIRQLIPDARVGVGHGQMPEDELERTMLQFAEGEFDVLVCTTIIESGLDIPNANTLVVNNADRFGLAQLYQLRGRVGRSRARAYAYFLYTREAALSEVASERLKTIFEATELGAGMRIAMKDLEIRGAGNLLGAEQSGHIAAIGFDLYTKLLGEQVALLRARSGDGAAADVARRLAETAPISFDVPLSAFIPPEYVPDDAVRLRLYQRFSAVDDDQGLSALVAEVEDRFGPMPEPLQHLVYLASLRLRAAEAGVEQISATDGQIVVRLAHAPPTDLARLEQAVGAPLQRGSNQVRLPKGGEAAWMGRLYTLVEALPKRT